MCKKKHIYLKNKGVYNTKNKMTHNEYVVFMNSGDVFYDDFVPKKVITELGNNIDLVLGKYIVLNRVL